MKFTVAALALVGTVAFGAFGAHSTMAAQAPKSQWDGIYTADQAKRGGEKYAEACGTCHGPDLAGGEMAPALSGGEFSANWDDLSLREMYDRIKISMPANEPGSLSAQQTVDLIAFILAKASAPTGAEELPSQPDALSEIKYRAIKP
jgi:mono/diheme cytochrome c family protein